MAFGARVEDIFRLVVGQGMPVLAGLALGIGAAAGISRLVASELFGMTPADPLAHAVAIGAVLIAALVALVLPARRATRVDPVTTLRSTQPSTGVQEIRRPNLLLNSLCLPDPMKLRAGE
jgi:predicted lysophospholipase L1 biosynthesis ABC-type transport system permease subunit